MSTHRLTVQKPLNPMSLYSPTINLNIETKNKFIKLNNLFYKIKIDKNLSINKIELNSAQRENHNLVINSHCITNCGNFEFKKIKNLKIKATLITKMDEQFESLELENQFLKIYENFPVGKSQIFYMKLRDQPIKCKIEEINLQNMNTQEINLQNINLEHSNIENVGIIYSDTKISFFSDNMTILQDQNNILLENFNFFSLGIGGLKKEFSIMFRRAFLSRVYSKELMKKLQIEHVKGIILYGPPGTGKTLIARQIGKLLNAREPKVVNGPEILNKFVGQSEENIRLLFKDAEEDAKKGRDGLHIIIFDEIDAICKKRASTSNFTDQVVNQLLAKIDGVYSLNNILIIGMTNRIDLIDNALLRPGRFEIHIEIGLPSVDDRKEILEIHTKKLFENKVIENVDLEDIAKKTNNYTGAELSAVVKSAVSYSLERGVNKEKKENVLITMNDFQKAVLEVKPSFGLNDEEFRLFNKNYFEIKMFTEIMEKMKTEIEKLFKNKYYNTSNYLLFGNKGTGKTSLAVRSSIEMAKYDNLYIKMISPRELIGYGDYEKIQYIKEIFLNAYKSERSIIILDDIESLIDYVSLGPRFSNLVLQTIKTFLKLENKNKIFIICTCLDRNILEELDLLNNFDNLIEVGKIPLNELKEFKVEESVSIRELLGILEIEE